MKGFFISIAVVLLHPGPVGATGIAPQPAPEIVPGVQGTWNLRWWAIAGRTYFIQASDDLVEWHFAPVIESGIDDWIEYETGSSAERHFVRLWYTDQATSDPDTADFDDDGVSNLDELELLMTHPFDWDTDDDGALDGAEAMAGSDPNDADSGGIAVKGSVESNWTSLQWYEDVIITGTNAVFTQMAEGDDFEGGDWTEQQGAFTDVDDATSFGEVAGAASTYPLPAFWEEAVRGLWWKNIKENRSQTTTPDYYRDWTAGRLKHCLRLNRPAPKNGYRYPFQVLKLHWQRAEAEGSPWTPDAANLAIVQHFELAKDEVLSNELEYDPVLQLAENKAVTLHAIRFEEAGPERGFDDHVRYLPELRFEKPWLAVANSTTPETLPNAAVKLHFSPVEQPLNLEVEVDGGHTATVTPNVISGQGPVELTIEGSADFGQTENSYEGVLKIEGVPVLQLAFYKRQTVLLAVHEIALINDDVEVEYTTTPDGPSTRIEPDKGKPSSICVRKDGSSFDTQVKGGDDDFHAYQSAIHAGPNGICETERAVDDEQVIPLNQGEPNVVIITEGANGELNTAPNLVYTQDDAVIGTTITTGPDGIRQTPDLIPRAAPANVPTQQQLQDYLDATFGLQTNVWFEIVEWNQADVAFDVASPSGEDANYPQLAQPNHYFDFYTSQKNEAGEILLTREEQLVRAASWNDDPEMLNLYFIAAPFQSNSFLFDTHVQSHPLGYARSVIRSPYISAYQPPGTPSLQTSTESLVQAAAHELAHNDLFEQIDNGGLHHPWHKAENAADKAKPEAENGLLPHDPDDWHTLLDQQADRLRLMWFQTPKAVNPATGRMPGMLLKHEADRLQETNFPPNP